MRSGWRVLVVIGRFSSASLEVTFADDQSNRKGDDKQDDTEDDPTLGVFPPHVPLQGHCGLAESLRAVFLC
jgi:hypothetical protein